MKSYNYIRNSQVLEPNDEWTISYKRMLIFIEEKEYEAALRKIIQLLDNFDGEQAKVL